MGKRDWRSPTPESNLRQAGGYYWLACYKSKPPGQLTIRSACCSSLVSPFCILKQTSTSEIMASYGNVRWCVFAWPLTTVFHDDHGVAHLMFDLEATKVAIKFVIDPHDWQVLPHLAASPLALKLAGCDEFHGIAVRLWGASMPLLQHALMSKLDISADDLTYVVNTLARGP